MPACVPLPNCCPPHPVAHLEATSPATRLQGRSLVPRSLPIPALCRAGDALHEPRGGGTARVERESMPPAYGCERRGVYPSPSGNEVQKPTEGVSPGQNEVQSVLSVLIFLERSPLGVTVMSTSQPRCSRTDTQALYTSFRPTAAPLSPAPAAPIVLPAGEQVPMSTLTLCTG